ncbi:hypothetical protein BJV82DRAFT_598680 [Fennellomyces sp. T-0311]|nr:hypothetical protein BJV82DRAFT_598680 [Fennellomyces sp. T-0311]
MDLVTNAPLTLTRYWGGGNDILGPLAVGGQFSAPGYIVNANEDPDCSADIATSFASYALVVQGLTNTTDTDVHGSSFHAGGGTIDEIHEEDPPCEVYSDKGTGRFDFRTAEEGAIDISELLAMSIPNHVLTNSGELTSLGGDSQIRVFTFNTCNNRNCPVDGALSDPAGIFFNDGNFNGPSGDVPSEDETIVFNIPVTNGDTITLTGNQPSQGFYACRTIYNFYPVNENGIFLRGGEFTLVRQTGSQLEGFSLAPRGHIRDGTTGNFAGTIVGYDYTWDQFPIGVEIHDYPAANCASFVGCLPINPGEMNMTYSTTERITETEASVTITEVMTVTRTDPVTITEVATITEAGTITEVQTVVTVSTEPGETVYETVFIEDPSKYYPWNHKGKKEGSRAGKKGGKGGW